MSRQSDQDPETTFVSLDEGNAWDEFLPEGSRELQRLSTELQAQVSDSHEGPLEYRRPVDGLWKSPVETASRALVPFARAPVSSGRPAEDEPVPHTAPPELTLSSAASRVENGPFPVTVATAVEARVSDPPVHGIVDGISLAHVLAHRVPVKWPEAVAAIEELCAMLVHQSPSAPVPTPQHIIITPAGDVHVVPGSTGDRDTATVGRLLHSLLAGAATPLPLRLFVTSSIASSRYESIGVYADALSEFARPNRAELIGALCRRALQTHGAVRRPTPAALEAREEPDAPPAAEEPRRRQWWLWFAAGAGVTLAAAAGAVVGYSSYAPASSQAVKDAVFPMPSVQKFPIPSARNATTDDAMEGWATPVGRDLWALGAIGPFENAPVTSRPSVARSRSEDVLPLSQDASDAFSAAPVASGAGRPGESGGTGPVEIRSVSPAAPEPPLARVPASAPAAERERGMPAPPFASSPVRVYTSADADVVPPVVASGEARVLSPALPGSASRSAVELLIDERGIVQSATVVGRPQRWDEMMMLSSLKNQRYRPALKDGIPVPYRLRIEP